MLTRFKAECTALYTKSLAEAKRLQYGYIGVEHVALALLNDPVYPLIQALHHCGHDALTLIRGFEKEVSTGNAQTNATNVTPRLSTILALASSQGELTPRLLVRSILLEGESMFARFLVAQGIATQKLLDALSGAGESGSSSADATRFAGRGVAPASIASVKSEQPIVLPSYPANVGQKIEPLSAIPVTFPTPTLDKWGRDLRTLAEQGRLSDAIGREREIEQMITILARTQKANPILLGDAGVGKTAIVEALAWRVTKGMVPPILRGKRIIELQMGQLMSGTSLRGQFEERITQIVREATDAPDVILFIDEIHTIVGAGGAGAQDAAQILKPALARGDVDCIGATTQDEFNHFIRKDPALERRFSPVLIDELSEDATLRVLQVVAPRIAAKHSADGYVLTFDADSLKMAVDLTNRYVKDRQQPDKAIDAIDIAAAGAVVGGRARVTANDVAAVVSEWTGIQVQRMSEDDRSRFNRMEQVLSAKVIGQDAAVKALSQRVRAAMAGVKAGNRPVGVFLFLGPSGVGKTSLAKELASFLFENSAALSRFDMSEYHDAHTVANLIGSPLGYRDNDQGGALTEALRRYPYGVVLLDEIEKAHPDIMNIFLGVFDEGRITDNRGRMIDCSNAIFVLTSNLGAGEVDFRNASSDELRSLAERFMRRELVNRITSVIGFQPLDRTQLANILDHILAEKSGVFEAEKGITLEIDQLAKNVLLDRGYSPDLGARPLERAVDEWVVQPLVDAWFANRLRLGAVRFTVEAPAQSGPGTKTIVFSQN
jgi:ATP-dependent Clp protease ATP-binding subunit ClpC